MRSLTLVIVSFFTLAFSTDVSAQFVGKKYLRKNYMAPISTYGDSSMYSRGIYVDSQFIYLGSSDGSVRRYDPANGDSKLLIKLAARGENRDLEFSNDVLFAMQSGDNGSMTKIASNGSVGFIEPREWRGVFLDALDFNGAVGLLMGDPVDGYFTLYHTKDGGINWSPCEGKVAAISGEAAFAASGSNVRVMNDSTYMFISGGMRSNFYKTTDSGKTWTIVEIPYYPSETTGAYSMCFSDEMHGVVVGGNYKQPELRMNTTYFTHDGGATWYNSRQPPRGYRSCVFFYNNIYYCCGRNGIDFSFNGEDWFPFADGAYYALAVFNEQLIATMSEGRFKSFKLVD
jgi:hypothetical protein